MESRGSADLVAHFFRRAFYLLCSDGTFGLFAAHTEVLPETSDDLIIESSSGPFSLYFCITEALEVTGRLLEALGGHHGKVETMTFDNGKE